MASCAHAVVAWHAVQFIAMNSPRSALPVAICTGVSRVHAIRVGLRKGVCASFAGAISS